jgi:hypothetical protein
MTPDGNYSENHAGCPGRRFACETLSSESKPFLTLVGMQGVGVFRAETGMRFQRSQCQVFPAFTGKPILIKMSAHEV